MLSGVIEGLKRLSWKEQYLKESRNTFSFQHVEVIFLSEEKLFIISPMKNKG